MAARPPGEPIPDRSTAMLACALLASLAAIFVSRLRANRLSRARLSAELDHQRDINAQREGELAAARAFQVALMPRRYPAFPEQPEIDVFARSEPARDIGGDLFDYLMVRPGLLFFLVGDVCGKGIRAALFMAMTKEIVRDAVRRHGPALNLVLDEANARIAAASGEVPSAGGGEMMFVTAFAGLLDLTSGDVEYASAGHDGPLVLRAGQNPRRLATAGGPPLGAVDAFRYPVDRDRIDIGDVLLLYTDGVTEALSPEGKLFSAERLSRMAGALTLTSAKGTVDAAFDEVSRFAAEAGPADDITLLALRRTAANLSDGSPAAPATAAR